MAHITTMTAAVAALNAAWPTIVRECRQVLGSELHYQAMIYHALRRTGRVPIDQLGMNVKQWIDEPTTELFQIYDSAKVENYQGGFEPIPDIVLFHPRIRGDWRRRNRENKLKHMLLAIEVKASERHKGRLRPGEVMDDIDKLDAQREELRCLGARMKPIMLIIDTAPEAIERMTSNGLQKCRTKARDYTVDLLYLSPSTAFWDTTWPVRRPSARQG